MNGRRTKSTGAGSAPRPPKMVKAVITTDEMWPVFYIMDLDAYGQKVEIPLNLRNRYLRAMREFREVQNLLAKEHANASGDVDD